MCGSSNQVPSSKCKALSSVPRYCPKRKKEKEEGRKGRREGGRKEDRSVIFCFPEIGAKANIPRMLRLCKRWSRCYHYLKFEISHNGEG
jgi:hypothetical protein